jgi:hypothetical protein
VTVLYNMGSVEEPSLPLPRVCLPAPARQSGKGFQRGIIVWNRCRFQLSEFGRGLQKEQNLQVDSRTAGCRAAYGVGSCVQVRAGGKEGL